MEGLPFLEDVGLVVVDEDGADVAFAEEILVELFSGVDDQVFGVKLMSVGLPDEGFPGVVEERGGDFAFLEVHGLENFIDHCSVMMSLFNRIATTK